MISDIQATQIELALWPLGDATPGSLWAILDCARDKRIYSKLQVSRLDFQCLYTGNIPMKLRVVAPHIVELSPRYGFAKTLLQRGWGRQRGIFARLNDGTRLRHHLRKLLTVSTDDGRKLLFRYYDPGVLRLFLGTCMRAELTQVFGPVNQLFAEGSAEDACLHAFCFDGAHLAAQSTPVVATL